MSTAPTPASPIEALKAGFRRACVRRLVGDEGGAVTVLRDEIPGLVVGWAKSTSLDPAEKKAKLKEMFDDESSRADELAVAFDLFAGRFETRVAELVQKEVSGLAKYIEQVAQGMSSVVEDVNDVLNRLKNFETPAKSQQSATPAAQTFLELGENSPSEKGKIDQDAPSELSKRVDPDKITEDELPSADTKERYIEPQQIADEIIPKVEYPQLDPPAGTGLRFDEIEEMIDEILSYETK